MESFWYIGYNVFTSVVLVNIWNWTDCVEDEISITKPILEHSNYMLQPAELYFQNEMHLVTPVKMLIVHWQTIAVDGKWSLWKLGACSVKCGGQGSLTKTRTCTPPVYGGKPCQGPKAVTEQCQTGPCPGKSDPNLCLLDCILLILGDL